MNKDEKSKKKKLSKKEYYKGGGKEKSGGAKAGFYTGDQLVAVYADTRAMWDEIKKKMPNEWKASLSGVDHFPIDYAVQTPTKYETPATIQVINSDSIDCGQRMASYKYNPLVLSMASMHKAGGGVGSGSTAQEEEIARRSTYMASLDQPSKIKYNLKGAAYLPDVLVFRDSRAKGYAVYPWSSVISLSFVAVPAVKNPNVKPDAKTKEYRLSSTDEKDMLNRIELIFKIGYAKGHDCLVLGAFGCGAYHNPPKHVAELFQQVVERYKCKFKSIVFAILTDKNDTQGNFSAFQSVFNHTVASAPTASASESATPAVSHS